MSFNLIAFLGTWLCTDCGQVSIAGYRQASLRNYINAYRPIASELCCNITLPERAEVAYTVLKLFQHLYSDILLFHTQPCVPVFDNNNTFKYLR